MRLANKKNQAGFSLVEVIIAINISVILFLIVSLVYFLSQNIYQKTDTRSEIIQNGRVILDRMVRELRQAQNLITTLPENNSDPASLPSAIEFQDGHNSSVITYIKYHLNGTDIERELTRYHFVDTPNVYVHSYDLDQYGDPPVIEIVENKVIGEYVSDLEFYGHGLITINLSLAKNSENMTITTAIYGRNL